MPSLGGVGGHAGVVDAIGSGRTAWPPSSRSGCPCPAGRDGPGETSPRSAAGLRSRSTPPAPHDCEDLRHGRGHLGLLAVAGPRRAEFLPQRRQLLQGPLDPPAAGHGVLFGLAQAVIPDQPIAFGGRGRLVAGGVAVEHLAFLVGLLPQRPPGDLALGHQCAEGGVFAAGPRQHGDEAALALVEVGHVLAGGQLAVGHVEEVAAAGQLAEQIPGVAMGLVVGHVAAFGAEVQRHAAVGGDREDEQQLLQVGTMVLVVAEGDGQRGAAQEALLRRRRWRRRRRR